MSLKLTNFKTVAFDTTADTIFVDDEGKVAAGPIDGAQDLDLKGAWLSPGWSDLHVHVWHGGTDISIRASEAGRPTGVTSMADAGSAGEASFHGLREYVIEPQAETIKAFLNIGSIGLVACNRVPELQDWRSIDIDKTLEVIEANRDVICGIKVRASGVIVGSWGITPAKIAKRVAEMTNLPLMVHVGEPPPLIDEVFEILTPGDIVTHCFNGKPAGSIRDTQALFRMAQDLAERGILMDIGHGGASFNFRTARESIADGLRPFSISTDLHKHSMEKPVYDMATTMSKLLAVGLPFEDVMQASTNAPRSVLDLPGADGLTPGERADFTVFDLVESEIEVLDSQGNAMVMDKVFEPRGTVLGAEWQDAARRLP
ncbi:amidohydrolase/deacetylase family metallohydrolase [Pelagovum pacificum]|uniref:Amidohydrolase/deacetylase family metallohydrolase n=1 Tax=Pelagovum pacificum TaxID=2588711 RepID=A0A5C5GFP4_9RHOB|nr:amidohydrolase/deacetylase family metallohydrolase [Pelagovum pacificum]QQA43533.1 amidohydrolase/deacetylase family metallohydrolase [Pelagovum pacificum]TNY33330.1 amidohydrolase/deacetylase family metallohydrolase [Pelagovum pacificum]